MGTADEIIVRIERYCTEHDIAASTFGRLAVNDGKLMTRLKRGKSITLDTLQKIEQALNAARPPAVSTPEVQTSEAAE